MAPFFAGAENSLAWDKFCMGAGGCAPPFPPLCGPIAFPPELPGPTRVDVPPGRRLRHYGPDLTHHRASLSPPSIEWTLCKPVVGFDQMAGDLSFEFSFPRRLECKLHGK